MRLLLILPAALLLGGFGDPEFGATVRGNLATQAGPLPRYEETQIPGATGRTSVAAYQRFIAGKQKALVKADLRAEVGQQGGAADAPSVAVKPQ